MGRTTRRKVYSNSQNESPGKLVTPRKSKRKCRGLNGMSTFTTPTKQTASAATSTMVTSPKSSLKMSSPYMDDGFMSSQIPCEVGWNTNNEFIGTNMRIADILSNLKDDAKENGDLDGLSNTPSLIELLHADGSPASERVTAPQQYQRRRACTRSLRQKSLKTAAKSSDLLRKLQTAMLESHEEEAEAASEPSPRRITRSQRNFTEVSQHLSAKQSDLRQELDESIDLFKTKQSPARSSLRIKQLRAKSDSSSPDQRRSLIEDLWTDDEFGDESFVRVTQAVIEETGFLNPLHSASRCLTSSKSKSDVLQPKRFTFTLDGVNESSCPDMKSSTEEIQNCLNDEPVKSSDLSSSSAMTSAGISVPASSSLLIRSVRMSCHGNFNDVSTHDTKPVSNSCCDITTSSKSTGMTNVKVTHEDSSPFCNTKNRLPSKSSDKQQVDCDIEDKGVKGMTPGSQAKHFPAQAQKNAAALPLKTEIACQESKLRNVNQKAGKSAMGKCSYWSSDNTANDAELLSAIQMSKSVTGLPSQCPLDGSITDDLLATLAEPDELLDSQACLELLQSPEECVESSSDDEDLSPDVLLMLDEVESRTSKHKQESCTSMEHFKLTGSLSQEKVKFSSDRTESSAMKLSMPESSDVISIASEPVGSTSSDLSTATRLPTASHVSTATRLPTASNVSTATMLSTALHVTTATRLPIASHVITATRLPTASHVSTATRLPIASPETTATRLSTALHVSTATRLSKPSPETTTTRLSTASHVSRATRLSIASHVTTATRLSTASHVITATRLPIASPDTTATRLSTASHGTTATRLPTTSHGTTATRLTTTSHGTTATRLPTTSHGTTATRLATASHGTRATRLPIASHGTTATRISTTSHIATATRLPTTLHVTTATRLSLPPGVAIVPRLSSTSSISAETIVSVKSDSSSALSSLKYDPREIEKKRLEALKRRQNKLRHSQNCSKIMQ